MGFIEDKKVRTEYYNNYIKGWKMISCSACSGSGYYDNNGSPKCGGCDGQGKVKVSPDHYKEHIKMLKSIYGEEYKNKI